MKVSALYFTLFGSVFASSILLAARPVPVASIESPAAGHEVSNSDVVTIQTTGSGHPIVAVRAKQKGSLWWIQESPLPDGPDTFTVRARFGNEATRTGTLFEIATWIADDSNAAQKLAPGAALKQLPVKSEDREIHEVVFQPLAAPVQKPSLVAQLLSPLPGTKAQRLQSVVFRMENAEEEELPLLAVRSAEQNGSWWLQEPMRTDDSGELLMGVARVGNDKTVPGAKFLMALIVPSYHMDREALKAGHTLSDISDFRCSESFTVISLGAKGVRGVEKKAVPTSN